MDKQKIAQLMMATYLEELHDHIGSITRELLALERQPDPPQQAESWTTLFRVTHTLKGASGMADVQPIRDACHLMEEIFGACRDRQLPISEDATSTLFATVDAFEDIGSRLRSGEPIDKVPLHDLIPELERLACEAASDDVPMDDADDEGIDDDDAKYDFEVNEKVTALAAETDAEDFSQRNDDGSQVDANAEQIPTADSAQESMLDLLMPVFVEELGEHVAMLSAKTLALEKAESPEETNELLNEMLRAAHSLKGAARVVELDEVQDFCHRLEDLLSDIRDGKTVADANVVSRILVTTDAITDAGDRLSRGESLESAAIQEVSANWERRPVIQASALQPAEKRPETRTEEPAQQPALNVTDAAVAKEGNRKKPGVTAPVASSVENAPKKSSLPPLKSRPAEKTASIRVPAQKLDALLAHNGELLVVRGRLDMRAKDARELRDLMSDMKSCWRASQRKKSTDGGDPAQLRSSNIENDQKDRGDTATNRTHAAGIPSPRVEELGIKLGEIAAKVDKLASAMEADNRLLGQTCGLLDDEVYHVRMLPFFDACGGLERAVRDIAKSSNKQVTLRIEGADVEVDRSVLEGLKDPLMHLVRNAVDHGIEATNVRVAAGKPAEATVTVAASLRGGQVEVRVEDDGAGLDLPSICSLAQKRGLEVPDDPREQARLVFTPGFSTAKMITDVSGRGVGLDVVQNQVESLHGDVDLSFDVGVGTRFTLMVPLTLTTIRCMMVRSADQTYAIPTTSVQRLVRFGVTDVKSSAGRETLMLREAPTPLVALESTLGLKGQQSQTRASEKRLAIVMAAGEQRVAIAVDDVMSESEVLVKNPGPRIRRLRYFSGCTLLPNGRIALVMNAANVVRAALGLQTRRSQIVMAAPPSRVRKQLLLAEDSMTTRLLLKNILETAGYVVIAAADGQEAWELAQEHTLDAVVSDVDMPRADGFELTEKLRGADSTAELPIVLVTARGTDQDKERGVAVGASAYIVKGSFDQKVLLETLEQLV